MKRQMLTLAGCLVCATLALHAQEVYLRGNIVPDGKIELSSMGGDQWQSEVVLDDSHVFLFSDKYVYFDCPAAGYRSDNIRINGGTYTASFNLSTKAWSFEAPVDDYRISAFGSSVCNGQGASGNKGYAYLYGQQLQERYAGGISDSPFYVSGISIGGNTTQNLLDRYAEMTRDHARYVIIGLSMGNEGIHESANKQQTMNQFATNMQTLIRMIKADGKVPVVMNNYTRGDFTADDYYYIKQLNLLIHEWDVSSVNTLGAIDDGAGHWASGYQQDNAHPTTNGHKEFFYAMPPSLFDAIAAGKAQPKRDMQRQMTLADGAAITFQGEELVHPFTISLRVKGRQAGAVFSYLLRSGSRQAVVGIDDEGHVFYTNTTNKTLTSTQTLDDDLWHTVTLTHYYAQGRTLLYLDTDEVGELRERINSIGAVTIGSPEDTSVSRQIAELFFYRSAFSPEEVQKLVTGGMLKSSLELYVPTAAPTDLANLAMTLNGVAYVAPQPLTPSAIGGAQPAVQGEGNFGPGRLAGSLPHRGGDSLVSGIPAGQTRGVRVAKGRKYVGSASH